MARELAARGWHLRSGGAPGADCAFTLAALAGDAPREVCELALAHVNSDRVEAAYRRTDLFERRRVLMEEWSGFNGRSAESGEHRGERLVLPPKKFAGAGLKWLKPRVGGVRVEGESSHLSMQFIALATGA